MSCQFEIAGDNRDFIIEVLVLIFYQGMQAFDTSNVMHFNIVFNNYIFGSL